MQKRKFYQSSAHIWRHTQNRKKFFQCYIKLLEKTRIPLYQGTQCSTKLLFCCLDV